jgi:ATP-dependent helicase HepA
VPTAVGTFVCMPSGPYACWGPGKLAGVNGSLAQIQYFHSPGAPLPDLVEVPVSAWVRARLPAQTRVYRRVAGGRWQAGRVLEDDASVIFVQFPNGDTVNVPVAELQVRWNRPLTDPLPLLASEATETPFLADARAKFVQAVAAQHHAAAGVSAVLCSSIELVDYQFAVIRRVLTDPIQRYLLADEVGLGKTIEASVIIRQYFIDDPNARAVVVVPASLVYQWRKELTSRFGLGGELEDTLYVVAHDNVDRLREVIQSAGMLVVDEAHHLSRQETSDQREFYRLVREHARRVPRLLLLSATPVLGNAQEFLRVLHLLDPVVFPLDDFEGFKRRITSRQVVAEVISTLVPENVWGLGPDLDRLLENYADDPLLVAKVEALKEVLSTFPTEEDPAFVGAMEDLKTHLVESYRLHRRLLRNRRSAVSWATPKRAELRQVTFTGATTSAWLERLERLRLALAGCEAVPPEVDRAVLQVAVHPQYAVSLERLLAQAGFQDRSLLNEAQALDRAAEKVRSDPSRVEALRRHLRSLLDMPGAQAVIFCDLPEDADRVSEALRSEFDDRVVRHVPQEVESDAEAPWQRFLTEIDQVRVLVCDARAEEGINLHGGRKIAFHFDLPSSPNRIEQRLGRLDRYGTGDPILSIALVDEGNPNESAWAEVLNAGWGIFRQSVASLQYLVESTAAPLAREWIEHGTDALRAHTALLGGADGWVQREIRQLNHQDRLDAMANQDVPGMETLEDADEDWADWRAAFKALAIDTLRFHWRSDAVGPANAAATADSAFRIGYSYGDGAGATLLPLTGFLKHFLSTVDQNAAGGNARYPLTYRYAFKRHSAINSRGLARGIRLLRIGDPLVKSLESFAATDDRGRAFGVWRVDRQYAVSDPSGADLHFRFDFMVRPAIDLDAASAGPEPLGAEDRQNLQTLVRKASTFLPPLTMRIWVHGNGSVEHHPNDRLTAAYSHTWVGTRRDFNLNHERWRSLPAAIKSTWMRDWAQLCVRQRDIAVRTIHEDPVFMDHVAAAVEALRQEKRLRRAQGEARASRLVGAARDQEVEELRQAEALYALLEAAIGHPRLDLEVVGAVFLASDTPFEE